MTEPTTSEHVDPDDEYLPSRTIAHSGRYYEQWVLTSASARRNYPPRVEPYDDGADEVMHVFEPNRSRATVIFIHGGYWEELAKEDFSYLAPELLKDKCRVVIPDYSLVPTVRLPQIVEQLQRCVATVARRYAEPLVVAGHSAGGHLAAMLHSTDWSEVGDEAPEIVAGIGLSGLYDLDPLRETSLQQNLALTDEEVADLSPVRRAPTTSAPFLTVVGELETDAFHGQSRALADAWGEVVLGPNSRPGHNHFTVCDELPRHVAEVLNRC
ncbi:alpha/beta hydrolase [Enemella dayhoffiae]|uniref:Alpha/beta hydrolase n=1 Tax=Enemella dayhoffiae TaxID=2016507 RepID=A0A255HDI0_9ACTN|nr:alpha/beta hydrolase [Enemella dayhoffiae]OYO25033.1 alpha/beta hydrolase [Enemella dayhoffiae]